MRWYCYFLVCIKYNNKKYPIAAIPTIPKTIVLKAILLMGFHVKKLEPYRRLVGICYNGGIPIDYLKIAKIKIGNEFLCAADFDHVEINFERYTEYDFCIDYIGLAIENMKKQLFKSSSEATIRSLFIDNVITSFFCDYEGSRLIQLTDFKLISEWQSRSIFPDFDQRIVDFVALIKTLNKEIPILIIEIGKKNFNCSHSHKDFKKLLGLMSATCISLAHELNDQGKMAELSRVYGIWIGGSTIHFCVAHPVLTRDDEGKYEIHCNLSFPDYWKFDILTRESQRSSSVPLKSIDFAGELEILIDGRLTTIPSITEEEITSHLYNNNNEVNLTDFGDESEASGNDDDFIEKNDNNLYQGHINLVTLKKLKLFIECVKKRMKLISEDSKPSNTPRELKGPNMKGIFYDSLDSAHQTPESKKLKFPNISNDLKKNLFPPSNNGINNTKTIIKKSLKELRIYRKLSSMFPTVFPRLLDANVQENKEGVLIYYTFEELKPILDTKDYSISSELIYMKTFSSSFIEAIKFCSQCFYGLYLLHQVVGIIHSDLSIKNIMYSPLDMTWKILDFDQSEEIFKSKKYKRIAGTTGYIAPEALNEGIFSESSDIYSLGQVILNVFYPVLLDQLDDLEVDSDDSDENLEDSKCWKYLFSKFEQIMLNLVSKDPKKRHSVIEALDGFFEIWSILQKAGIISIDNNFIMIKNCLEQGLNELKGDEEEDVKKLKS